MIPVSDRELRLEREAGRCDMRKNIPHEARPPFEVMSKRRRSFPSKTRVKCGQRIVHGDVELVEKLGCNDPFPGGSGRRFQALLPVVETL